jgi:preprotein translocase subunit SecG
LISYLLYAIFILACLTLIISVLLQPGKADAGQLFTSSVSSTAFGPRGTQTILSKITIGAAITFMVVALLLGFGVGGQRSLMEGGVPNRPATPAPAAPPAQQQGQPAQPGGQPAPAQDGAAAPAPTGGAATPAAPAESNPGPEKKQ